MGPSLFECLPLSTFQFLFHYVHSMKYYRVWVCTHSCFYCIFPKIIWHNPIYIYIYIPLLLLHGQHQRHRPAHKSRNIAHAVCVILIVQYQEEPSADTVESQRTARCWPQRNNKPFNVGEFMPYAIYSTQVVVSWCNTALGFASCCISHLTTPLVP